jgi:hypothetical protein
LNFSPRRWFSGVAIGVFLSFQLPRILRPRVHVCFLRPDPASTEGESFLEQYEYEVRLAAHRGTWLHLRITNVGTIYYSGVTVSCILPPELKTPTYQMLQQVTLDPLRPSSPYSLPYDYRAVRHQISFHPRDDPRDTGPGDSAVYSFYLTPDQPIKGAERLSLVISVHAAPAGGRTQKELAVIVTADDQSEPVQPNREPKRAHSTPRGRRGRRRR